MLELEKVKRDIEEKNNSYKPEVLVGYYKFMFDHTKKVLNMLQEKYKELIELENSSIDYSNYKVSDWECPNFLIINGLLNEYSEVIKVLKLYSTEYFITKDKVDRIRELNKKKLDKLSNK